MRPFLTAAAITIAALALTSPDIPGRLASLVFATTTSVVRIDADLGFRAPSACEIRTLDKGAGAERPARHRVRVCS